MDIIGKGNLSKVWDDWVDLYGKKPALIVEDRHGCSKKYSYTDLNEEINRTANLFLSIGIKKGDKVALHLYNSAEFIFCWFGLAKIGGIVVPVNVNLLEDECAYILQQCESSVVVTSSEFHGLYDQLLKKQSLYLKQIMLVDSKPENNISASVLDFIQLKNEQPKKLTHEVEVKSEDCAEILFTSGTTSKPKGVVITHYNLIFAGYYSAWQCSTRNTDVYLTAMPSFHVDCQCMVIMPALTVGATMVLIEKYSASSFWKQVCQYRATITECIPMMIRTLLMQPETAWEKLHCVREVLFFLNLSEKEKNAFIRRFGVNIFTSYGLTETIVGNIGDRPGDKRPWPSIGRVGMTYEAKIINSEGNEVDTGEIGEICIKGIPGKTLFKEYYNLPEITANNLSEDGWLRTGDCGYVDSDGFFFFVERACNMIKRCGENVSCSEVENIISTHPKIVDVAVIGLRDQIKDEAIKAFIVLREGEHLTEEEFFTFCNNKMAKFKVPSYFEIITFIPRNCSGKVLKKELVSDLEGI